jgi:hypothetical protein
MPGKAAFYLPLMSDRYSRRMDTDFDREAGLALFTRIKVRPGPGSQAAAGLDWHRLRARLAAGQRTATVQASPKSSNPALFGGSFDSGSARALAVYGIGQGEGQGGVNPTALGNGNSRCGNDAGVAGANSVGDRG